MSILLTALLTLALYMTLAFVVSLVLRDNGIADIAYGGGFALVAWVTYALGTPGLAALVATILATVWALRLSIRIYLRNHGKPEDFRYRKWREEWGKTFVLRSFLQVYMLQGAVIYVVALPLALLNAYSLGAGLSALALLGFLLWAVGFYFEAVGDYQLARFLGDPANKGMIMDRGLWRFSRHPNYFGESVQWWGLALVALATLFPLLGAYALLAFLSPVLITFLLLKVSGVPLLEKRFAGEPAWEAYKAKTSVFIPLPPRR